MSEILWGVPLIVGRETGTEIDTNLNLSPRGANQMLGMGLGSSITGKHSTTIVTDDIVTALDRVSAAERERTKLAYAELQNIRSKGGRIINCGTPWHKADCISIMPNVRKFDCYSTGIFTPEELQAKRDAMSKSLFAANYELRHIADGSALFDDAQMDGDVEKLFNGFGHIDAAYGGGDDVAFTIMKHNTDGTYTAFGKLWKEAHVENCLTEIYNLWEGYRCGTVFSERNADKGYLAKSLQGLEVPAQTYHEQQNKYVKISTHLKKAWKKIHWIPETDPEYLVQITDYTEQAAHDDAPDSAASLIRIFEGKNPATTADYLRGGL
jgi:predicted phage terminase large subunit-like protein